MRRLLTRLSRTVGIHRGEERLFLWGAATLFLLGWASVSLTNVAETLFLKRVGVDRLPFVFLANGVLLVGSTYAMSHIATRADRRRLLASTFAGLALAVLLLWILLLLRFGGVFVLLVIASKQLEAISLVAFWIVVGSLLHGRQAKRLYAPIIAGGTLGRIIGSFASGAVGNAFGIAALLPISATAITFASVLAGQMRWVAPARLTHTAQRPVAHVAPLARFGPLWRESRLFRVLAFGSLLGGTLGPMLYFQFSYIVDAATHGHNGEMRLLDLYAKLRGFINAGVLAMQLVGTARVFRKVGVPLASTLSPVVYILGFLGVSVRLDLPSGIGAVGSTNLQDHAIQEPAQRILVTLFPERLRAAATSLIEGPVQRFGGALGNVLVLTVLAIASPAWVGFTALPIAFLWLGVALSMWRIYPTLLLEAARSGIRSEALRGPEMVDPATMRSVESSLADPDPRVCRAACELALEAPARRAVTSIARALHRAPARNRPLLVEALNQLLRRASSHPFSSAHLAAQLEPYLADPAMSALERAHLVEAYGDLLPPPRGPADLHLLEWLQRDREPAVQLAARFQLRRFARGNGDFDAIVGEALGGDDAPARQVALEALGRALLTADESGDWERRTAMAAARLANPVDRRCAAELLAAITAQRGPEVNPPAEPLLAYARDRDPRVRSAAIRFIGDAGLDRYTGWLIGRLASEEEVEAAAAKEALLALGPRTTSALLDALHRDKRAVREAVCGVLADMPANARGLRSALERELLGVRRTILVRQGLRRGLVSDLVLQRLAERIAEGLHTVLFLLATILHEDRIADLAQLLARSPDGRGRALLLEALEALLPPDEAKRLLPLLESEAAEGHTEECARVLGREVPTFEAAAREALGDKDALTRTFLAATLPPRRLLELGGAPVLASARDLEHHRDPGREARQERMLKRVEIVLHLRTLDLFSRLTTRELSDLAAAVREETYSPGSSIVREGEFGDCMYIIVEGEVRLTREGKQLSRFQPGEFLGEMSMFDGEARFATATAVTTVRLLRLERIDLLRLMDEQPSIAISVCQQLSRHVRELLDQIEGNSRR